MTEMPFDVLNTRLGKIRDNGDIDFDNTAAALDIDMELQSKFLFFPIEELEAVEIEENRLGLSAGSGPEHCAAGENENPNWLYNHAVNALALYWRLKNDQEDRERLAKEQEALAQRPEPGVYLGYSNAMNRFTVIVTEDRRVLVTVSVGGSGAGMNDCTALWDERARNSWILHKVDLTDGSVEAPTLAVG